MMMKTKPVFIKGTSSACYRSGEWAEIVGVAAVTPEDEPEERNCFRVRFADGAEDWWPLSTWLGGAMEISCPVAYGRFRLKPERFKEEGSVTIKFAEKGGQ